MYTNTHQSTIDEIRGLSILYNFELKKFHRMNSVFRGNSRARTISPLSSLPLHFPFIEITQTDREKEDETRCPKIRNSSIETPDPVCRPIFRPFHPHPSLPPPRRVTENMPRPRLYYRVCEILSINRVGMEIISTSWIACNERPARLFRLIDFGDAASGWRNNIPNGFVNVIIIGRSRTIRSRYVNLEREREREIIRTIRRFIYIYIRE